MADKKIVIPGEVIAKGNDYLPGEWTEKKGEEIVAIRFGVFDESDKLVRVIPISGTYQPRKGNVVIGEIVNILPNGWFLDIGTSENAFLSLSEVPKFINRGELASVMDIGDVAVAKIFDISGRGIDLTVRSHGMGRIDEGIIMSINSNKVPRVIGKEGSMINIIKDETRCNITVGQNGSIWISGENAEDEILAKKAITFITEKFFMEGLTDEMKKWFEKEKGK